jgi:hypothetical protein
LRLRAGDSIEFALEKIAAGQDDLAEQISSRSPRKLSRDQVAYSLRKLSSKEWECVSGQCDPSRGQFFAATPVTQATQAHRPCWVCLRRLGSFGSLGSLILYANACQRALQHVLLERLSSPLADGWFHAAGSSGRTIASATIGWPDRADSPAGSDRRRESRDWRGRSIAALLAQPCFPTAEESFRSVVAAS